MKYVKILFIACCLFTVLNASAQTSVKVRTRAQEFIDSKIPLLLDIDGYQNKLLSYSFFLRRLDVDGGLISRRSDPITQETVGYRIINLPIINIICQAYDDHTEIGNNQTNRILFETKDKLRFIEPNPNEVGIDSLVKWKAENTYCYELKVPVEKSGKVLDIMKHDIEQFFNIKISIEKRIRKCLVLVRTDSVDRLQSKAQNPDGSVKRSKEGGVQLKNASMDVLLHFLKEHNGNTKFPIVDGTNYKKRIDLDIKHNLRDVPALIETLKSYGLTLTVADFDLDMIVVKDAK